MSDKIIKGNFGKPEPEAPVPAEGQHFDEHNLTPDQRKAIGVILSGTAFVFIGIKPGESGADFFTALHGEPADLRNAQEHLPGVIQRLYDKRGI